MEFKNLSIDTVCDCLNNGVVDNISRFAIKTMKDHLRDNDFKTYWEKGRRAEDCKEICSLKGQSLTIVNNDQDLQATVEVYRELFPFSPKYKSHITLITLKENSGYVKHTPIINVNTLHHDFYKCDNFTLNHINFISSIPLGDV